MYIEKSYENILCHYAVRCINNNWYINGHVGIIIFKDHKRLETTSQWMCGTAILFICTFKLISTQPCKTDGYNLLVSEISNRVHGIKKDDFLVNLDFLQRADFDNIWTDWTHLLSKLLAAEIDNVGGYQPVYTVFCNEASDSQVLLRLLMCMYVSPVILENLNWRF